MARIEVRRVAAWSSLTLAAACSMALVWVPQARAATAAEAIPPRITAVLPYGQRCASSRQQTVDVASAEQKILRPVQAWQLAQGRGETVAVLDTGAAVAGSVQLAGQVSHGPAEVSGQSADQDCVGHGTFVAALIVARPRVGSTIVGIAPQAHVLSIVVTDARGATSPDVIGKGILDAVRADARIILVSAVSPVSSPRLNQAVKSALARGSLVIAPVVADDQSGTGPAFPAALPGVLAVGNSADPADVVAAASHGWASALLAPGDSVLGIGPDGGAFIGTGAAYSSALVAGAAALVRSYRPTLTTAQLIHRLQVTAYPVAAAEGARPVPGIVDPYAAVSAVLPEEAGPEALAPAPAPAPAIRSVRWPAPPNPSRGRAILLGGAGLALLITVLGTVATARRGRERHWRPGTLSSGRLQNDESTAER